MVPNTALQDWDARHGRHHDFSRGGRDHVGVQRLWASLDVASGGRTACLRGAWCYRRQNESRWRQEDRNDRSLQNGLVDAVRPGGRMLLHFDGLGLGLHHMYVPFAGRYDIGILYLPIALFTIVGTANAVNFSDGLDTLAAGLAAIAFVAYGVIAYRQGQIGIVTFSFTMVGSLLGFLWFNAHPAQVFMGDTGSLSIGAALAVAAFMTGQWLLLPVVGGVFVAEALSVIIQVGYFRITGGKRIFKMTPLHHHFEQSNWSETQITMRFWIVGMMCGLIGVALALL